MRFNLAIFAALAFGPYALAYGPCDQDEAKLCTSSELHGETTKTCLHFQAAEVSDPDCRAFLQKNEPAWKKFLESFTALQNACQSELQSLCPTLVQEKRRLKAQQTCLMSEREKLGSSCKAAINSHIRSHQPQIKELE